MASTSKTSHEAGDLRLCVEAYLDFTELHPWQQLAAVRAQHSLNVMAIQGQLDLRASKRIFEYGAGTGGATYALGRLATLNGGSVEAAELEPEHAAEIAISGILPPENIHIGGCMDFKAIESQRQKVRFSGCLYVWPGLFW